MGKSAMRVWLLLLAIFIFVMVIRPPFVGSDEKRVGVSEFIARIDAGDVSKAEVNGPEFRAELAEGKGKHLLTYADSSRAEVIKALREKKVPFEEYRPSPWMGILMGILPFLLPLVLLIFIFKAMGNAGKNAASNFGASKAKMHRPNDSKKVTFADVAGVDEAVEEVRELVDFLKDPKRFSRLGARIPKGVLLMGPPGTGKTLIAKAVAGEAGVPFFSGKASEFVEMFVGVGASRVRDLFEQGRKNAPCIIFIDELDAVGRQRGGIRSIGGHDEREQTLNQILTEMDGFTPNDGLIVIAATNQPEVLDEALLRAGRFDRHVVVPKPDLKGRDAILKVHAKKLPDLAPNVNFTEIARGTAGMVGADLESMLNEAALRAARLGKKTIDAADIWWARDKVMMGPERKSTLMSDAEKWNTAVHECGHAITAWRTSGTDPVHKVTIVPRGQALGLTMILPLEDRYSHTRAYLDAQIRTLLGGRTAEQLFFGNSGITTGASNDLERVRELVHRMVCDWGMSDLGLLTYRKQQQTFLASDGGNLDCSPETAALIDQTKKKMVDDHAYAVTNLLTEHRAKLEELAKLLLEKETIEEGDLLKVLGPPTQ